MQSSFRNLINSSLARRRITIMRFNPHRWSRPRNKNKFATVKFPTEISEKILLLPNATNRGLYEISTANVESEREREREEIASTRQRWRPKCVLKRSLSEEKGRGREGMKEQKRDLGTGKRRENACGQDVARVRKMSSLKPDVVVPYAHNAFAKPVKAERRRRR